MIVINNFIKVREFTEHLVCEEVGWLIEEWKDAPLEIASVVGSYIQFGLMFAGNAIGDVCIADCDDNSYVFIDLKRKLMRKLRMKGDLEGNQIIRVFDCDSTIGVVTQCSNNASKVSLVGKIDIERFVSGGSNPRFRTVILPNRKIERIYPSDIEDIQVSHGYHGETCYPALNVCVIDGIIYVHGAMSHKLDWDPDNYLTDKQGTMYVQKKWTRFAIVPLCY